MGQPEWETQTDVLRSLPTRQARIPRNFRELYHSLAMCHPNDGLDGLLKLIDFSQGSVVELLSLLYRRAYSSTTPNGGDPLDEFCAALLSNEFRTQAVQSIL